MAYTNTRDVLGEQTTLDMLVAHELTELKDETVTALVSYALYGNSGLQTVEMPGLYSAWSCTSAFALCSSLVSATFQNLRSFATTMFQGCIALTSISAPEVIYGAAGAFSSCTSLPCVSFPKMSSLAINMFFNCKNLSSVSFSTSLSAIPSSCFYSCTNLRDVSFPGVKNIYRAAFYGCTALATVSFPAATSISQSAFYGAVVGKLVFPSATTLGSNITDYAAEVDLSAKPTIPANAFTGDYNMISLVLRNASQLTLANVNALTGTPIASGSGHIFVPADLVDTYKSATNWTTYASQIVSVTEYPKAVVAETIADTWEQILDAEDRGTYSSKYSVGDTKVVNIGSFPVQMQIVAIDTDELADNTGNAKITWLSTNFPFKAMINQTSTNKGGWEYCYVRNVLMQVLYDHMDSTVKTAVKSVKKTFLDRIDSTTSSTRTVNDKVWIPSLREMFGDSKQDAESSGCVYTDFFASDEDRIKKYGLIGTGGSQQWWLRSAFPGTNNSFYVVNSTGGSSGVFGTIGVAFGFCT